MTIDTTSSTSVFKAPRTSGRQGYQGFLAEIGSRPARPARRTSGRACKSLKTLTSGRPACPPPKGGTYPDGRAPFRGSRYCGGVGVTKFERCPI